MLDPSHSRVDTARWSAAAAICISLLAPTIALAQEAAERANVLGRVFHSESHAALPDAVIEMPGLQLSASSDETGLFFFRDIPAGEHMLIVHYLGYVDTTVVALTPNELNQNVGTLARCLCESVGRNEEGDADRRGRGPERGVNPDVGQVEQEGVPPTKGATDDTGFVRKGSPFPITF